MSPHTTFTRIPLQVGSELRIRNNGEVSVDNPTIEAAPALDAADAVLDYRFDPQTNEHVIRLVEPVALRGGKDRGYALHRANATVTGLAFFTGAPAGVNRPDAKSTRHVTTVSDCSLAAQSNRCEGSKPINRGVRPWLGTQPAGLSIPDVRSTEKTARMACPRLEQ